MPIEGRPKFSPEIARQAAQRIVERLIRDTSIREADREASIEDIAKHGRQHQDGYQLAKTLDDYAHWDCDFPIAEVLDGFSHAVYEAIGAAEKEWAERVKPQPPFPVGTRVRLHRDAGEITGIYAYGPAKYLVKIDGDPSAEEAKGGSRRVVNFEDAKPEAEAA